MPLPASMASRATTPHRSSLQVPLTEIRKSASQPVVGVWASASRREHRTIDSKGRVSWSGQWVQVSRLGNPLINEVVIPRHLKDYWNGQRAVQGQAVRQVLREAGARRRSSTSCIRRLDDANTTGRTDLSLILLNGRARRERHRLQAGFGRHAAGQHSRRARRQRGLPRRYRGRQPARPRWPSSMATCAASRTADVSATTSRTSRSVRSPRAMARSSTGPSACRTAPRTTWSAMASTPTRTCRSSGRSRTSACRTRATSRSRRSRSGSCNSSRAIATPTSGSQGSGPARSIPGLAGCVPDAP